jgi:intein-encoded DNA endonuclease-like protein
MPIFKTKNKDFFKKWSPEMAYILGFFCADGSMIKNKRGAHFIDFQIRDRDLLLKIRRALGSNHKIGKRKKKRVDESTIYKLQIGSKDFYEDLLSLGLKQGKSSRLNLPEIPNKYLPDFIRGYFDGDGNVIVGRYRREARNNKFARILRSGFTSGSGAFLKQIKDKLSKAGIIRGGTLYFSNRAWRLYFSINDSKRFYYYIYNKPSRKNKLFLRRKQAIFENFIK